MKVEKQNQKRNSVHVSCNYGNKLMRKKLSIFVLYVDAQYALNTRAARV